MVHKTRTGVEANIGRKNTFNDHSSRAVKNDPRPVKVNLKEYWMKKSLDLKEAVTKRRAKENKDTIKIFEPIWKDRSIGIREDLITDENFIEILYRNKSGTRVFPYIYVISGKKLKTYPKQTIKNISLHIVPISDLIIYRVKGDHE